MSDEYDLAPPERESPNKKIDQALKKLMSKLDDKDNPVPLDVAVKVINAAVAWEKVKLGRLDKDDDFDPDSL